MTIPVPLSVRLKTSARDIHITPEVDNLVFGSTSPGGYDNCTVSLHRPLNVMPGEVKQFGRLYVYGPTGVVWEGRMQDPGRTAGSDGEVYDIAAVGGQAHLQDDTIPYIMVDRDMSRWVKDRGAAGERQSTTVSASEVSGNPILMLSFPAGLTVPTDAACTAIYWHIINAGHKLAILDYSWDTGITNGSWEIRGLSDSTHIVRTNTANTAGGGSSTAVVGVTTNFVFGDDIPYVQFKWTSAPSSTGGSDDVWASIQDLVVATVQYNKDGTEKTSGYSSSDKTILASTVVADLLGRLLSDTYDGATAAIATTSYAIDQLAYPDGVNPAQVLEDLLKLEQAYTWHVWESNPSNSKFKFEWVAWPTSVRYEADIIDGFQAPASGNTIFNRVRVRYRSPNGLTKQVRRDSTVPSLVAAGFSRAAFIDQGDEVGSSAAATQAGDGFLSQHIYPLNAGRLTVARPILDLQTGRMVQPYEVRAGSLIRVRGVESYPDSLNASSRDGLTVFKIAATSYSAQDAAATLDLDSYAPSVARAIAALRKRPAVRRR